MKIRALTLIRGAEVAANPGDLLEVADTLGRVLVEAHAAVEVATPPARAEAIDALIVAPEAAVIEATELAVLPSPRGRRAVAPPPPDDEG